MTNYTAKDVERFWAKVDKSGGNDACWLWLAFTDKKGYGKFWYHNFFHYAPRVSYAITYGIEPQKLFACHSCDNPSCVNPAHIFLATTQENTRDRNAKNRQARGETQGLHVLTWEQVRKIRARYAQGGISYHALATEYRVARTTIACIIRGETWKDC